VTFWNWRRGAHSATTSGTAALAVGPDLAAVELYTAETRIVGWVSPQGHRMTDLLNERDELRIWRPSPAPFEGRGTPSAPPDDGSVEWVSLPTQSILLAMPPEWRASRQLRLHKRLRRVAMKIGPFDVTGNAHMPPGAGDLQAYLLRTRQRFLPVTDAYILHRDEPAFEHVVSVAIVNVHNLSQLTTLVTLA
jgi:hypothetical protein